MIRECGKVEDQFLCSFHLGVGGGFIFYLIILSFYFPSTLQQPLGHLQYFSVSLENLEIRNEYKEYSVYFPQIFKPKE